VKKFANAQGSRCSERALIEQKKLDAAAQPLFASLNEQQKRRLTEELVRMGGERDVN
jgi:hypothetical protein